MYLADVEEYKAKFELFISKPKDEKIAKELGKKIQILFGENFMDPHTSHSIKVDGKQIHGWAFFPISVSLDGIDEPVEVTEDNPRYAIKPDVKEFLRSRLLTMLSHEVAYGPSHNRHHDWELYDGIKLYEGSTEVDCFYFYDDVRRYK